MLMSSSAWVPCTKVGPLAIWSLGALPRLPWMWSHQEACCPQGLRRGVAFWAWGSAEAPVKEELLKQMVAWHGRLLVIRWMGRMWAPTPSICDRRLPVHLWVLQGWHVRQLERNSIWLLPSSWMTCYSRCLMVLACHLWSDSAWEAPRSQLPWRPQSRWFWLSRQCGCQWPWLPWWLRSRGPQHPWQHGHRWL